MLRIKVLPPKSFLISFLHTKGLLIVDDKPQILHYIGNSLKELKHLLKEDKPDLLINHSFPSFEIKDQIQVYHPLKNEQELFEVKKVYTNHFGLCQFYYQRLGLQEYIVLVSSKKKKKLKVEGNFQSILKRISSLWNKFKDFMSWD